MQNQNTAVKNDVTYDKQKKLLRSAVTFYTNKTNKQKTDDIVEKSAVVIEALKKDLKSRTAEL